MSERGVNLPPEQAAIRAKCFHPSGTFVEFPKEEIEQSIPERFEKIVQRYPRRLALRTNAESLTYEDLNNAANCVGRVILESCRGRNEAVVLLADQTINTIIACIGILKAGKVLVTVDPTFPAERMIDIAIDSNAAAIFTNNTGIEIIEELENRGRSLINLDFPDNHLSTDNIGLKLSPDAICQIRYTSGTTGKPKGVLRSHRRNLYSTSLDINVGGICPDDSLIALRHFSVSIRDVFNALLAGAVVCPFDIREGGFSGLANFIAAQQITYYISTPSIFRYFIEELQPDTRFPSVRMVRLGGEPLFRREIELFKRHFSPQCVLVNHLGGNETGGLCNYFVTKETVIDTPIVPVGYPAAGKKVVLLDDEGNVLGINQVGEIVVQSSYLSSGFLGDGQHTDTKSIFDLECEGERIYRTGDLAQRLPNGCLIYVGRKDDQVKIRGCKVELAEVQAVLSEHPQIKQTTILALDHTNGEKYLTAYVVPSHSPAPTVTDLTDYLKKTLPEYAIPTAFIFLDAFPLANGKLDRKSLPQPDHIRPHLKNPYVAPRSLVEGKLTDVWTQVLGLNRVGIHDDFFDLGGHSLAATRVVSQVVKQFQVDVPLRSLFESPTIAAMAVVITEHQGRKLENVEIENILKELDSMSEEEAREMVAKGAGRG